MMESKKKKPTLPNFGNDIIINSSDDSNKLNRDLIDMHESGIIVKQKNRSSSPTKLSPAPTTNTAATITRDKQKL